MERTGLGARQSVKEAEYMCHVFVRSDKLSVVCVSDHEYPPRVAHTLLQRMGEDFAGQISPAEWSGGQEVGGFNGQCEIYLNKFQDPTKSDAMSRLQTDLDDTKIILVSLTRSFRSILLTVELIFSTIPLRQSYRGERS